MRILTSYNSLENPIGIETRSSGGGNDQPSPGYNSLENPIGIETSVALTTGYIGLSYNSLENPIGIETIVYRPDAVGRFASYNSLENPIGIETRINEYSRSAKRTLQLIRKPDRD